MLSDDHFAHDLRHLRFSTVGSFLYFFMADLHRWLKAAQVGDDAHTEDSDATVTGHDHLGNRRHADRITPQEMIHSVLRRCLEGRTLHAYVDTMLQRDTLLLCYAVGKRDQFMVVGLMHIREAGTGGKVLATQRMLGEEIDMVGDDHHVTNMELRVHAAGGIADKERLNAQLIHHTHRKGNLLHRVTLIEMETAIHSDDIHSTELTEDEFPRMSLYRRHREIRNILVRDFQRLSYLGS